MGAASRKDAAPNSFMTELMGYAASLADASKTKGLPPVERWNPPYCGEIDLVIRRDGLWIHEGAPIGRAPLVRLFSTVLKKEGDRYFLMTPVEKLGIRVEDAPFLAVLMRREGRGERARLVFTTNVGDEIAAGPDHAVVFRETAVAGEKAPYIHVRGELWALVARAVFYELVGLAETREIGGERWFGVASGGEFFPFGPASAVYGEGLRVKASDGRSGRRSGDRDPASWRALIRGNLQRASAQRVRALFHEINPHLVGDKLFEERWSDIRTDAAVLVPIIDRHDGATVLLTVRSSDMPSHAGQISFPGGKLHAEDRGPVDAALREAREEVNIDPAMVEVIGALGVHQGGLGFSVTPIVGIIDPSADIRACPREVAEVFEVPLAFFADLDNHLTEEREHRGVKYNMFAAPYGRFHIWGLTAGILRTLAETLQDDSTPGGARGR